MAESLSRRLARFATELDFADLPPEVVDKIKALTLQGVASALAGSVHPGARRVVDLIKREESTVTGGSTILVDGARVTKGGAAFAISELVHRGGRLDIYRLLTHPGTTILPAAFVAAEAADAPGEELIVALAAGYEAQARLAGEWVPSVQARGFRSSPVFGIFGATVAAGRLLGLTEDQLNSAIALAVDLAAGNLEGARNGSDSISIHEPSASRNALLVVLLARDGVRGGESSLEGDAGFYHAHAGNNEGRLSHAFRTGRRASFDAVTAELGRRWELLDTAFRIYAIAGYNLAIVEIAARLSARRDIRPADVASVEVVVNWHEALYPSPRFPGGAHLAPKVGSPHYYAAWGIIERGYPVLKGRPDPRVATAADEPAGIRELMERVRITPSRRRPLLAPRIAIETTDGRTHTAVATGREFMFDLAEETRRIRALVPALPVSPEQFEAIVDAATNLERLGSVHRLIELTLPAGAAGAAGGTTPRT